MLRGSGNLEPEDWDSGGVVENLLHIPSSEERGFYMVFGDSGINTGCLRLYSASKNLLEGAFVFI